MHFVNWIRVPFPNAVNTFNLSDSFLYSVGLSGGYGPIPYGDDNFDVYATGGGVFTQLFFSGSGNWNGSGYTVSNNFYLSESFDNYVTGERDGLLIFNIYNSGLRLSGYSALYSTSSGYVISPNSITYLNSGYIVSSGAFLSNLNRKRTFTENYSFSPVFGSGDAYFDTGTTSIFGINFDYFVADISGISGWRRTTGYQQGGEIFNDSLAITYLFDKPIKNIFIKNAYRSYIGPNFTTSWGDISWSGAQQGTPGFLGERSGVFNFQSSEIKKEI